MLPAVWAHACWSSHPGSVWIGRRNESCSRAGSSWKRALLMTVNLSSFPAQKLGAVCADNPIYLLISAPFTLNYWAHSCQLQLVISWVCVWRTQETFSSDKYRKKLKSFPGQAMQHRIVYLSRPHLNSWLQTNSTAKLVKLQHQLAPSQANFSDKYPSDRN